MTMNKNFSITAVDHYDTLFSNSFDGFSIKAEQKSALRAQFATQIELTLKNSNGQLSNIYPTHSMKDNKWTLCVESNGSLGQQDTLQY
jgi:hypothetical protein